MARGKYPLDPLLKLRDQRADDKARDLAKAVSEHEAAERARLHAEAIRVEAERKAQELRDAEAKALLDGQLRVGDLMRQQAWEVGVAAEQKHLTHQVSVTQQTEQNAGDREAQARGELAASEADAEVVHQDKERFTDREKRTQDARDEEAAAEAWRPKRG